MNLLLFVLGLASLVAGASLLVRGASKLALSFGISPLVVGLTIVAFGTSAPEVAVSVGAVLDGKTDIAVGNVVGSNIFNVLFILGVSALITPLVVNIQLIRQDVPIMVGASLLLLVLGLDGRLGLWDAAFLFVLLIAYTVFLVRQSRRETSQARAEYAEEIRPARTGAWDDSVAVQITLIVGGLVALVYGSDWLVTASVNFAKSMGVSDLVIGLTIVAAGTSRPEVATSIAAALKGGLATPVVPDNPTPIDLGRHVYYQNCMPCHGDVGQGLTEEWRNVWVEDHRNCWGKGCHGGRLEDEGFPLPQAIPAVIGPQADAQQFETISELVTYLQKTHPPQQPGRLALAEYEEVAAFLWHENQRAETTLSPVWIVIIGGSSVLLAVLVLRFRARRVDR